MKIIAISGWKRSGKDTAAEQLIKNHGFSRIGFADPLKDMVAKEYDIPREHCDAPEFKEKPILTLPVLPKDNFTLNLAKMLYKEFRTETGHQVPEFHVDPSGAFIGLLPNKGFMVEGAHPVQLYWTPRALCILKGSSNRAVRSDYWVKAAIDGVNAKSAAAISGLGGTTSFVISDLRYRSELDQLRQAFGKNLVTVRVNRFDTCASDDPSERDLDSAKFDVVLDNKGTIEEFQSKVEELVNGTKS